MAGDSATFRNLGTVTQTGSGHAILIQSGKGLVVTNGSRSNPTARIETRDSEPIQAKAGVSGISLDNFGTVLSRNISGKGSQAVDFSDVAGANSVDNHAHGELRAIDADALRPGNQGIVDGRYTHVLPAPAPEKASRGLAQAGLPGLAGQP